MARDKEILLNSEEKQLLDDYIEYKCGNVNSIHYGAAVYMAVTEALQGGKAK